jgi:hypothetical protein
LLIQNLVASLLFSWVVLLLVHLVLFLFFLLNGVPLVSAADFVLMMAIATLPKMDRS